MVSRLHFPIMKWVLADNIIAYGDMNLFCSCGPVESIDGMTGAAAPAPT